MSVGRSVGAVVLWEAVWCITATLSERGVCERWFRRRAALMYVGGDGAGRT